jgi:hypothetical protein
VIKQTLQIYLATQTWIQGELQIYLRATHIFGESKWIQVELQDM